MEHRLLGRSGLKVPVLSFGTATFGGGSEFFRKWGETDVAEATRLVDVCLDAGLNFFDTANTYSRGLSEEILGQALKGRRDKALVSTISGRRASTCGGRSRIRCGGWAPTTSTCTSSTASMR